MKTKLLLLSMVMLLCSTSVFSQSYYYYKGEKVFVKEDPTKITILSKPAKAIKNVKSISTDLQKVQAVTDTRYDISVYSVGNTKSVSSLKTTLSNALEDVIILPCYTNEYGKEMVLTNYLFVRMKSENDYGTLSTVAAKYNLEIIEQNEFRPLWYTLSVTPKTKKTSLEVANELFESGLFTSAFASFSYDARLCSYDPNINLQWGLYNSSYSNTDLSICNAWNYATGRGITIAVLDHGIEKTHTDLAANIHSLSYDTETRTSPSKLYGSHGTHCAGIAAAARNNGIGIAGVAPDAKLMAVSNRLVYSTLYEQNIANGIDWAWRNGAHIISCSWWAYENDLIDEAINDAITKGRNGRGTILVIAAGNFNSEVTYPANSRAEIIAVGAIINNGNIADYSCFGNTIDVVAPGSNIYSTLTNNSYGYNSGTSMATPHVAGIAALILERNPSLTLKQVSNIIEQNTRKVGNMSYNTNKSNGTWNTYYGYGLVNAYSALINTPRAY
jgi:subtilisin family serine protease